MSRKETDLYSICTLYALTKVSFQRRSTVIHGSSVVASNYSSIGQTLTAFNNFSNQSLSTSSLFSPDGWAYNREEGGGAYNRNFMVFLLLHKIL